MEKGYIKKKIHLALVALIFYIQKGTAFSTSPSALTSHASSTANIFFSFSIDAGEKIVGTRIWIFNSSKIAESDGTTLTPVSSYSSRLTAFGTSGISLSDITVADAGTYTYVIVLFPTYGPFIATTALSVQDDTRTTVKKTSTITRSATTGSTTTGSTKTGSTTNDIASHQLVIIIGVCVGFIGLVTVINIIICCCLHQRRKRKKDQTKHKAHHAIARNGSKSTNEQNELHNVTNILQVDSCVKM